MSVKKVEEYKKYKANRKEILAKEKKRKKRNTIIGYSVLVAIVGIFIFTIYLDVKPEAADNTYRTLVDWNKYQVSEEVEDTKEGTAAEGEVEGEADGATE